VPSFGDWGFVLAAVDGPPPLRLDDPGGLRFLDAGVLAASAHFGRDVTATDVRGLDARPADDPGLHGQGLADGLTTSPRSVPSTHACRHPQSRPTGSDTPSGPRRSSSRPPGEETDGSFFLAESLLAPGFPGPPLHRHRTLHDMFYILEGTLTVRVEGDTREIGPGTFVCVPPGVAPHVRERLR
jgi:mannose-6-phosphate isomerase-like protein (cupin superfamily)